MSGFEVYALQVSEALETEFRSPSFRNRVAFIDGLRALVRPDRFGRK